MAFLLAALMDTEPPRILSVKEDTSVHGEALVIDCSVPPEITVRREGAEVIVSMSAEAPKDLEIPTPVPPIEEITVERDSSRTRLRVKVPQEVAYEIRRDNAQLSIVFGAGGSA